MSHDQNFKNLILDYPRQALAFFAAAEAHDLPESVRITPLRQEQLQERLGERFRELDIPLLGGERHADLAFTYSACELAELPYQSYRDSDNLVARLNLPNMRYATEDRVAVYAPAVRGLTSLETDPERQLKYMYFIHIYAALDDNEQQRYIREYPEEAATMSNFAERFTAIGEQRGEQRGMQRGMQRGEATMRLRQLHRKFGDVPDTTRERVESADPDTLLAWSERILTAESIEAVLH